MNIRRQFLQEPVSLAGNFLLTPDFNFYIKIKRRKPTLGNEVLDYNGLTYKVNSESSNLKTAKMPLNATAGAAGVTIPRHVKSHAFIFFVTLSLFILTIIKSWITQNRQTSF